jgi:hypothetical protein
VINELTTVAGVWTTAQFLDGEAFSRNPVELRNAVGNAGNLVDPATGQAGPRGVFDGVTIHSNTLARLHSRGGISSDAQGRIWTNNHCYGRLAVLPRSAGRERARARRDQAGPGRYAAVAAVRFRGRAPIRSRARSSTRRAMS